MCSYSVLPACLFNLDFCASPTTVDNCETKPHQLSGSSCPYCICDDLPYSRCLHYPCYYHHVDFRDHCLRCDFHQCPSRYSHRWRCHHYCRNFNHSCVSIRNDRYLSGYCHQHYFDHHLCLPFSRYIHYCAFDHYSHCVYRLGLPHPSFIPSRNIHSRRSHSHRH